MVYGGMLWMCVCGWVQVMRMCGLSCSRGDAQTLLEVMRSIDGEGEVYVWLSVRQDV